MPNRSRHNSIVQLWRLGGTRRRPTKVKTTNLEQLTTLSVLPGINSLTRQTMAQKPSILRNRRLPDGFLLGTSRHLRQWAWVVITRVNDNSDSRNKERRQEAASRNGNVAQSEWCMYGMSSARKPRQTQKVLMWCLVSSRCAQPKATQFNCTTVEIRRHTATTNQSQND